MVTGGGVLRIALFLLALLGCFLAGRFTARPGGEISRAEDRRAGYRDPPETPIAAGEPDATPESLPAPPSARTLFDHEGGALVEAEIARRAARIREQSLRAADHAEQTARREVEREIARERAFLEDAARGGTMALLRKLKSDWTPPWEMLSSPERFAALVERKTKGGAVDGTRVDRKTVLNDGDVLQFPRGRSTLDANWLQRMNPFPKDLVIEGYGMNDTLLVLSDELRVRGEVHSLTMRNLTVHCNDNSLERLRDGPYALHLDRCRVIGFDNGAGGSKMLGGSVGAFYATDCRIEAGFGRNPGSGNLFDVRGALVARLERCTIVGPFRSVYRKSNRAAQIFVDCRFERMSPRIRTHLEKASPAVRFLDCTFEYLPEKAGKRPKRRPVTEINPAWGKS